MNFFISRLISILITLSIVVGSASADLDGLTAARRRPEDINPGWSVSQVIRQAFASRALWVGRFIVPSLGVVRHRAQDQIPRSPGGNLRRPGRIQSRILRWLLVFTPLGGQRPNLRDLHDELSKQIGTYLTDWDKEEWEGTLRELAGRDVVIVRNADASSVLTPIGNGAGAYVPLAQWNGKTIQLKESLFRIEPHLLRNIVLAFVLAHELSEIWIVEHPGRWKTRFLTALGGLLSPSQPLEMAAHILLWASASHMKPLLRGLRDVVYTPALSLRAVLPIHHAQTDDEGLVEKAYDLAQAEYRGASNLPSGMNYFAEVTREASVITTMNLPAAATVALLLRHLRPERLDPLERLLGIGQDQADDIRNLIAGLGRMTRNAWNPKLVAGKPTYAVQNFTNRAIKVTGEIATQLAESRRPESAEAGPLAARLQPSLLAMMFADRCVVLETVDLRNRPLLVRRLYDQILTVWSPLAERLGVQDVAERLADEALRFKYPAEYSHVKRARDVALGLTDEQEQAELGYMRGRLAAVARAAQLGADSFTVTGRAKGIFSLREKWLFRSQTKKKSDEPTWEINQSLDLLAYRIVVDNPREMDRLRHALGNGLSTPERPIQRLEEGREIARDSKGNIILEKFNVRYANPYDTTKTITAEVQVMTRGYFPTYLSGRSMARFYLGHWMMKAKRVVDNRLRGRSVPELALGEQFDHQDPPLTGDFSADVLAAAESLEPFEFPAVVGGVEAPDVAESEFDVLKLRKQNRYRRATRRHRKSKEARPDLNEEPLIADAAFHPTVGGRPSEYPQAVELPPAAADPSARQRPIPRSLWDPVSSSQMLWLNPTHTGKLDDAEYARLRDAVASASACLALMEGPGNQQEHLNELEREGRDLLRPRFGDPDDPEVQKQVLRPAMASLGIPLDRPDRLYQALALSDRHERKKFTADQSQFVPLHDDFQKWVDLNFVTRLASVEREPSAVKIVETIDESQVGVLAGDVATISGQGWNIRGFQQRQISELQYQIIYELDSGPGWTDGPSEAALRQLERALKLKQLRRGENPPPDGGRWLDIHVHFPPALAPKPGVLASAVQRLADKKVDVRSGRLQDLDLTLRVLAPAELARDKGAALVELLTMGGLADYVSVQSSPLSEATIDVLQQMVIEERERIEQLYNLDLRELGREPMSGLQARAPAPDDVVDEDAVGFFHQAGRLAAQWFGIGAYKPGEAFVHVKMRSDGKIPYFIHLLGVVRVVINEGRVRDMPAIIAWLLHDIFEEGPENAWAFIEPLLLQVAGYRSDEAWPSDRLAEWNKVLAEFPDMLGPLQQVLSALRSSSPAERDIRGLLAPLKADFLRIAEQKIRADIRRKFPEYADDILRRLDLYTRNPSESYAHYFDRVMRGDASDRIGKYADRYNNLLDLPERLRAADAELKTPVTEERRRQLNAFVAWASRYVEETVRFY
ncbi:MAG TPA: hypothetical protein VMU17_03315, partial [Elusimicrobiota bacterium]|nr:hypothetical protein [Elusimicrobiota bacterium]